MPRATGGRTEPYPTRAEIESSGMLAGQELAWLEDSLSAYLIHVNGSAKLELDDGSLAVVTVTRVVDGDVAVMAEREIESMRGFLGNRVASLDFAGLTGTLESEASISTP